MLKKSSLIPIIPSTVIIIAILIFTASCNKPSNDVLISTDGEPNSDFVEGFAPDNPGPATINYTTELDTSESESKPETSTDYTTELITSEPATKNNPTSETVAQTEFEIYDDKNYRFKIQHPVGWVYIDSSVSAEDFNAMIEDALDSDDADMFVGSDIDPSAVVTWYDFENITYANITVSDSGGITQNDLKSQGSLTELQNQLDNQYPLVFDGFQSGGIKSQAMGNNYFAVYKFNYSTNNISLSCYQAFTVKNGLLYTFTFTAQNGKSNAVEYDRILASLEFY